MADRDSPRYSDFSSVDKKKSDGLMFDALRSKQFEFVLELLEIGVPLDIKNEDKATPLLVAVQQHCPLDVIIHLTTRLDVIGLCDKHKMTPLHEAVLRNKDKVLRAMITVIQDAPLPEINFRDREQQIRACRANLTKNRSDLLNKKNKEGWTPLHYAADRGHVNVLQVLLMAAGCDVTTSNKNKQTAFHLAARNGHLNCLQLLHVAVQCSQSLDDVPKTDKNGWNLACHASAHNKVKVMEWLLRYMPHHADINHCTEKGFNPLLLACDFQKFEISKFLLNHEQISEIAATTKDGKTALHLAAMHNSVETVQLLLNKDFPIDQVDEEGETALHFAYKKGSYRVWALLLAEGADRNIKNKEGKRPEDLKYKDLRVPIEIKKRGDKAVEGYIAALKKGKKKMPRCKLMIVGEAGVGKTNLLNLLTGEEFVPIHEETEGVDIDLVSTHDISTETWRKSTIQTDEEYTSVAVDLVADELRNTAPTQPEKRHDRRATDDVSIESLRGRLAEIQRKYRNSSSNKDKYTLSNSNPIAFERSRGTKHFAPSSLPMPPHPLHDHMPVHKSAAIQQDNSLVTTKHQGLEQTPKPLLKEKPESTSAVNHSASVVVSDHVSVKSKQAKLEMTSNSDSANSKEQTKVSNQDDVVIIREASKKSKQPKSTQSTLPLKLTSFDIAGQKHYKPMHHCFITSRAIYVAAFNARQLVSSDQTVVNRSIQEIKFWINSIRVYTDAKVVLVGTHKGPYHGASGNDLTEKEKKPFPELKKEQITNINDLLEEHFDKDYCNLEHFQDNKIMALVESSIREESDTNRSGADVVRKMLKQLGDLHPGNKDDLPISYLRLEASISKKRSNSDLLLISHKELEQCAKDCDIDECQVAVALDFFHDIGIIIDPRNLLTLFLTEEQMKPLHDVVLIKPQWLADVMKELMNIDRGDDKLKPEGDEMKKALRQFKNEGKADKKQVLYPLWREYHNGSEKVFEQICLLLEAYGLIVSVQQSQCYYIPCKLPQTVKGIPDVTKNCHKVSVNFKNSLFPPFLLHHLMFLMYQEHSPSYCLFFDKECYMEYIKDCQWWIKQNDNCDSIDVTIRTKQQVRTVLPAMLLLHALLLRINKKLKGVCYTIEVMATCTACEQEQFFIYINSSLILDNQNESLQCSKCRNMENISAHTTLIKSKNYKYEQNFSGFKNDLKLDQLDENVRHHLVKDFKANIQLEKVVDDDDVIQVWFKDNRHDPWPFIVTSLSNYEDSQRTEFVVDKLKREMCNI